MHLTKVYTHRYRKWRKCKKHNIRKACEFKQSCTHNIHKVALTYTMKITRCRTNLQQWLFVVQPCRCSANTQIAQLSLF